MKKKLYKRVKTKDQIGKDIFYVYLRAKTKTTGNVRWINI